MIWLVYALCLTLFFILFTYAWAAFSFAPWVPCWHKDLARIFKLAQLKTGEIFYDLGCGNGKTVIYAADKFKAKAIGVEFALPLYFICRIRQIAGGKNNVVFKWKNLFNENLADADVVYFFGVPDSIKLKLKEKLERELKPGARVISYVFSVPGWTPAVVDKPTPDAADIYLYFR
ncbi:MAG: SAM-dependent methyltransferase [Patescibacteria group bacterium]